MQVDSSEMLVLAWNPKIAKKFLHTEGVTGSNPVSPIKKAV